MKLASRGMRILNLRVENLMRVRFVDITPTGNLVILSGANEQGKSAILSAIWWALAGLRNVTSRPIRDGEDEAIIKLDLGEIKVTRTFTRDPESGEVTTDLQVVGLSGEKFKQPQTVLNRLIGALAMDPIEFTRMDAKGQLDALRKVVPLEIDLDALDREIENEFIVREAVGRDKRAFEARVNALVDAVNPDWSADDVDTSAFLRQMQDAADHNSAIERERANRIGRQGEAQKLREQASDHLVRAARLREEAAQLEQRAKLHEANAAEIDEDLASLDAIPAPRDVSMIRQAIEQAQGRNEQARQVRELRKLQREHDAKDEEYKGLTESIERKRALKTSVIARAKMPVEGLGFGSGEVLFNGLPLKQASTAQQIRVALGIAAAQSPDLSVIIVREGSMLDSKSLGQVEDFARERELQVWMEVVDETGSRGFSIVDGTVAGSQHPALALA